MIWLNGEFREEGAAIDTADRGFLLGDGAFETILVRSGRVAFLRAHLNRLRAGLDALDIPRPPAPAAIADAIAILARENAIAGDAAARLTVTRGKGSRGLAPPRSAAPTVLLTLSPATPRANGAVRLCIAAQIRFTKSSTATFKSISGYVENMLALDAARREGADDAIMLNEHGRIASATAGNIVVIDERGQASTPPTGEGALPGIVRGALLSAGVLAERAIERIDLESGMIAITNSIIGVCAATPPGAPTPMPRQSETLRDLQSCYDRLLEQDLSAGEFA